MSEGCSRNWKRCKKGQGQEGNTRLLGPHGHVYLGWIFFFLTQRLKCFYLKCLFTFQSPKKKKKGSQAPGLYLSPAAAQTQHQSCPLSLSCLGDSHLPPASRDCAMARKAGWGSGERDWLGYTQGQKEHGPKLSGFLGSNSKKTNKRELGVIWWLNAGRVDNYWPP